MKPRTTDEKQIVLVRLASDLKRQRADALSVDAGMLACLLAMAEDEGAERPRKAEGSDEGER